MRILQVIPYFTPKRGGSVSVACNLSTELACRGHLVTIATSNFEFDRDYAKRMEEKGVTVVPFRCTASMGMFLYTPSMRNWLENNISKYDLIHLHNFRSYQNNIASAVSRKHGVPYLMQAHGSIPMVNERVILKKTYDAIWGRRILQGAHLLIAVSDAEIEHYESVGIPTNKIVVIPNGLDTMRFNNLPRRGEFKKRLSIEDKRVVLYLGRIEKAKRIDLLVRSFGILERMIPDAVLVIAGPDEGYRAKLEMIVRTLGLENKVILTGFIENSAEVYQDADVLVNPRATEVFGLVPFEAIMCGTPVIISDESACGEIMKRAKCGYTVDTHDPLQLANTIAAVLRNPCEGEVLVARGREFIELNMDWRKIARRFETVYEDCIRDL